MVALADASTRIKQRTALPCTMPGTTTAEPPAIVRHHIKLVGPPDQLLTR